MSAGLAILAGLALLVLAVLKHLDRTGRLEP